MTTPGETTVVDYSQLIDDGDPRHEREWIERRSPATGAVVSRYQRGTAEDAHAAIAVARAAFDDGPWPRMTGTERGRVILEWARLIRRDHIRLAELESAEAGKPMAAALDDIESTAGLTEQAGVSAANLHGQYFDNLGHEVGIVAREPVGVVGAITAWNFPAVIFASKVPFALSAGCTVIAKPSELTSATALELALLAYEAGVPRAALSVITGYGKEVGEPLAASTDVDMLSFTGSTATGNRLAQTPRPFPQRLSLELGGKGATIVFADADLDDAVDGALAGFCINQGQVCTAGTRLLLGSSIADTFLDRLGAKVAALSVGDPRSGADLGPLISPEHADHVRSFIDQARHAGARIIPEADPTDGLPSAYVAPAVITGLDHTHAVFQQEIFGPVLAVTTFDTANEAIALANGTTYGLANGVWTADIKRALTVSRRLKSGIVWVNSVLSSPFPLPFGGSRASGFGREKGAEGVSEFTQLKMITVELADRERSFPGLG
ncbi:aldehyde dehydrogenase family protein [Rhodococcus opacus]|uniref:aldehyde dehydrogenase family protein n=1 Tax=Rhodococcus opacus TaxID=37919 RepID=UPI001C494643|nr:aldehyde dehydrogenase family protein [Rhodococcus opacus]MBV6760255.1 aldehyde dehydrogenase family protein [Rhodococcus opacus]